MPIWYSPSKTTTAMYMNIGHRELWLYVIIYTLQQWATTVTCQMMIISSTSAICGSKARRPSKKEETREEDWRWEWRSISIVFGQTTISFWIKIILVKTRFTQQQFSGGASWWAGHCLIRFLLICLLRICTFLGRRMPRFTVIFATPKTTLNNLQHFCNAIINRYGTENLRVPRTIEDLEMIQAEDHFKEKNEWWLLLCNLRLIVARLWFWHAWFGMPVDRSPFFHNLSVGRTLKVNFAIDKQQHNLGYYLVDKIFPNCHTTPGTALLNFTPPPWCLRSRQHALLPLRVILLWTATITALLLSILDKRKRPNAQTRTPSLTSAWAWMPTILLGASNHPAWPLLPSSSFTHFTHHSLCRYHAKQEEVLFPAAIIHYPHYSVISYLSSPLTYLCWSYLDLLCMASSQWIPSDVL